MTWVLWFLSGAIAGVSLALHIIYKNNKYSIDKGFFGTDGVGEEDIGSIFLVVCLLTVLGFVSFICVFSYFGFRSFAI